MNLFRVKLMCALLGAASLAAVAEMAAAATPGGDGVVTTARAVEPNTKAIEPDSADAVLATFSYYNILGSALRPRNSSNTYAYSSNGCLYVTGGSSGDRLQFPLLIPDESVIKFLRLYYIDDSNGDLIAWITQYTPGQTSSDVTSISSAGNTGYGTTLSPEVSFAADNSYNYTINVAWTANDLTQQICGVRVAYYAPNLFRDGFE